MSIFTNADNVIQLIEGRKNRGYGLDHFRSYMKTLNDPQKQIKTIHVAGTNGKGSTTNDIRSVLQEAGYQVGSFTSPYMITHYDRIRINNQDIPKASFLSIVNQHYDAWMEWDLSMFEIDMCIACLWFLEKKIDFAVFEVGLGGRKDSTNIIEPLVSVITNIGMDHMELLGNTYAKIAYEKAGIIKLNTDIITAEDKEECLVVFQECAKNHTSKCITIKPVDNIQKKEHIMFDYGDLKQVVLGSDARYQCKNAALAIETLLYLKDQGSVKLSEEQLRQGLQKAIWIGRFEVISKEPYMILDGAHNVDGIMALCDSIKDIHNPVIIFSVVKDKNFIEMLRCLQSISDTLIVCQLHNDRALDIHELQLHDGLYIMEDSEAALQYAKTLQRPIIITGSLYFISEVRKSYIDHEKSA